MAGLVNKTKSIYGSRKVKPYVYTDDYDRTGYFWIDKRHIMDLTWAGLPRASQAVFPAIGCHFNGQGIAFPGQARIASMCNLSRKTVASGIQGLVDSPLVNVSKQVTARGKWVYSFKQTRISRRKFPFHNHLIHSGIWYHLTAAAKALYVAMRAVGYLNEEDLELYLEIEEDEDEDCEFHELYLRRKWDLCEANAHQLSEYSGVSYRRFSEAVNSLKMADLVSELSDGWLVYLKPEIQYKREYMNGLVASREF